MILFDNLIEIIGACAGPSLRTIFKSSVPRYVLISKGFLNIRTCAWPNTGHMTSVTGMLVSSAVNLYNALALLFVMLVKQIDKE